MAVAFRFPGAPGAAWPASSAPSAARSGHGGGAAPASPSRNSNTNYAQGAPSPAVLLPPSTRPELPHRSTRSTAGAACATSWLLEGPRPRKAPGRLIIWWRGRGVRPRPNADFELTREERPLHARRVVHAGRQSPVHELTRAAPGACDEPRRTSPSSRPARLDLILDSPMRRRNATRSGPGPPTCCSRMAYRHLPGR